MGACSKWRASCSIRNGGAGIVRLASRLSRLLKPFEVAPKKIRDGATTMRGYARDDFERVWARYLSPHPPTNTEHGTQQVGPTRDFPCSDFSGGGVVSESEDPSNTLDSAEIVDAFRTTWALFTAIQAEDDDRINDILAATDDWVLMHGWDW